MQMRRENVFALPSLVYYTLEDQSSSLRSFCGLESFTLILLGAFLSLSLYALIRANGREHRLAHISGDFGRIKDNTAFCDLQPNYVSCIAQKILMSTFIDSVHQSWSISHSINSFALFHSYRHYFTNNKKIEKRRNFNPFKLEEPIRGHRFASKLGTVTSSWTLNSAVHRSRVKQRRSGGKPSGYRITTRGYSGVTCVRRQRQNESNRTLGNSPRR